MGSDSLRFSQAVGPEDVGPALRDALIGCWAEVSNAGGAVGFPFPPVRAADVAPALDVIVAELDP